MKARQLFRYTDRREDVAIEMVLAIAVANERQAAWIEVRLYCGRGGRCLVRYDNETGKGDHRHGTHEEAYRFVSLERLIQDFRADCTTGRIGRLEVGMKRIEIEVLGGEAALKAFAKTWRQARTGRHVVPRIAFGSLSELFSTVTESGLRSSAMSRHTGN